MSTTPDNSAGKQRRLHELLDRVRDRCPDAARELVEEYGEHIVRVVRRRLPDRMRTRFDSQDFVQDVWKSFFADPACLRELSTPETLVRFFSALARNKVIHGLRQQVFTQKRAMNREHSLDGSAGIFRDGLTSADATPSQEVLRDELRSRLRANIPLHYRTMLEMWESGVPQDVIARRMGVDVRTVRRVTEQLHKRFSQ